MLPLKSKAVYEKELAASRDNRMQWWRDARFGMFIHFGVYSTLGRHEWAMSAENIEISEYEKYAENFNPKPGAPREWAALAKEAGQKYMVLTTRHHDGFSLWDSKVNPFNSVNYGPKRDIVREFVDACREFDLKIGFYSSLMDWHHPDGAACAYDPEANKCFTEYIYRLNYELLTQYGKIDILWYDVACPMTSYEGWDSLARNQKLRELQPNIIINNRSLLDEDFGTPEDQITAESSGRDWEACMTYNGISWGYIDQKQVSPYSHNAHQIIRMLEKVSLGFGNLLLNIGPAPDGSVPVEAIEPLRNVGKWLEKNGEAVYNLKKPTWNTGITGWCGSGVCNPSCSGKNVYIWNWIWPEGGKLSLGGYMGKLRSATVLAGNTPVEFEQNARRITLINLPAEAPDKVLGINVIKLEFEDEYTFIPFSAIPQLHGGEIIVK
ncbi:MAG: alpha-L-fucosidase [Eubacteriales bacterium]